MSTFFGIDLGTSNCAVAQVGEHGDAQLVPIAQVANSHSIESASLLPSVLFFPLESEAAGIPSVPGHSLAAGAFPGRFAREKGTQQPDRVITSAKSWLCHPHVDRARPTASLGEASP
ncbi:MAG: hypothetical protein LR015_00620 [Verrucomicrobia bacterium]|nr:hypothetical protein [Verrucomicrobiota bacterium]